MSLHPSICGNHLNLSVKLQFNIYWCCEAIFNTASNLNEIIQFMTLQYYIRQCKWNRLKWRVKDCAIVTKQRWNCYLLAMPFDIFGKHLLYCSLLWLFTPSSKSICPVSGKLKGIVLIYFLNAPFQSTAISWRHNVITATTTCNSIEHRLVKQALLRKPKLDLFKIPVFLG